MASFFFRALREATPRQQIIVYLMGNSVMGLTMASTYGIWKANHIRAAKSKSDRVSWCWVDYDGSNEIVSWCFLGGILGFPTGFPIFADAISQNWQKKQRNADAISQNWQKKQRK